MKTKRPRPRRYRNPRTLNTAFQKGKISHDEYLRQSYRLGGSR